MGKKVIRWFMNIIFFVIYFLIYNYIIGRKLPVNIIWNLFSLFIIILINIPLSIASTEKVFSIIEKGEKD